MRGRRGGHGLLQAQADSASGSEGWRDRSFGGVCVGVWTSWWLSLIFLVARATARVMADEGEKRKKPLSRPGETGGSIFLPPSSLRRRRLVRLLEDAAPFRGLKSVLCQIMVRDGRPSRSKLTIGGAQTTSSFAAEKNRRLPTFDTVGGRQPARGAVGMGSMSLRSGERFRR